MASSASTVCAGYEEMRREAIRRDAGDGSSGRGVALFLSRGMVAWIRALLALVPVTAEPPAAPAAGPCPVPDVVRERLTRLLVSMVLERKEGESHAT